jgi:ADP-heptose:LPS heptosyltransferase
MPVERLQPLLSQPDIDFHVLQKDIPDQDRALLATYPRALCHDQRLGDFADTAALILEMDLVITIDTAVAHLAGALAVPVWIMLPFNPDWRWLIGREDTPWYPTARLFRQTRRGAWDSVVQRVAEALAKTRFPLQTP